MAVYTALQLFEVLAASAILLYGVVTGSPTVALHFTDCAVPVEQRLGDEGEGFKIAMQTLDITRPMTGDQLRQIGIQQALQNMTSVRK